MPDIWTENPHTVPDGSVDWGGASGWGLVTGVLGSYPAQDQMGKMVDSFIENVDI